MQLRIVHFYTREDISTSKTSDDLPFATDAMTLLKEGISLQTFETIVKPKSLQHILSNPTDQAGGFS